MSARETWRGLGRSGLCFLVLVLAASACGEDARRKGFTNADRAVTGDAAADSTAGDAASPEDLADGNEEESAPSSDAGGAPSSDASYAGGAPSSDASDAGGAPSSDASGAGGAPSVCEEACAAVMAVECPGQTPCLPGCEESLQGSCGHAGRALQECVAGTKPSDFVCQAVGDVGVVSLSSEACQAEQTALGLCLLGL